MTEIASAPVAGVELVEVPRADWVPHRLAPFRLAYSRAKERSIVPFKLGEELEAKGVTFDVDWNEGD
jgi:hypothetical protein